MALRHEARYPRHYPAHSGYFQPRQSSNLIGTLFYLFGTLFIIAAGYVMFWPTISAHIPIAPPVPTVRPAAQPPAQSAPQAQPQSAPIEQAPAVAPTVGVIPAAAPLRFAATPEPPAWVPSAEQTAAYDAVRGTPIPVVYGSDASCNSANATYVTDPIKVERNGVPIGAVQGWSCVSEAEAVAEAQRRAVEMQGGK